MGRRKLGMEEQSVAEWATQAEVASVLRITPATVAQIERAALQRIWRSQVRAMPRKHRVPQTMWPKEESCP